MANMQKIPDYIGPQAEFAYNIMDWAMQNELSKVVDTPWENAIPAVLVHAVKGGTGKCFRIGTEIIMWNGTRCKVEDIKKGDLLIGPDSKPRKVLSLSHGFGPLYKIIPVKGEPYTVTGNHVLSLKESRSQKYKGKVLNIAVEDLLDESKYTKYFRSNVMGWRAGVEWPERALDPDLPPHLLGIWLGDGTKRIPQVTTMEPEVVAEMQEYCIEHNLRFVFNNTDHGRAKAYYMSGVKFQTNPFTSALRKYGIDQIKAIPRDYLINSREVRMELLAGIIDADGYLTCGTYDIINKDKQLADDIVFLSRSLGFWAEVHECQKGCQTGAIGTYYRVCISGDISQIPVRVPRRKAKPRKQCKDVLVTGITIEPDGEGEYYGFEVDGDHLFLLGDFTVTHNSSTAINLAKQLSRYYKVGVVDADVDSPNLPELVGIKGPMKGDIKSITYTPIEKDGIKYVSMGLFEIGITVLSKSGKENQQVIAGLIRGTEWGDTEILVVDCPAGVGDEYLAVVQSIGNENILGIIAVVLPVSLPDLYRVYEIAMRQGTRILGVVENFTSMVSECCEASVCCSKCQKPVHPFETTDGFSIKDFCKKESLVYLGGIPLMAGYAQKARRSNPYFKSTPAAITSALNLVRASHQAMVERGEKGVREVLRSELKRCNNA